MISHEQEAVDPLRLFRFRRCHANLFLGFYPKQSVGRTFGKYGGASLCRDAIRIEIKTKIDTFIDHFNGVGYAHYFGKVFRLPANDKKGAKTNRS